MKRLRTALTAGGAAVAVAALLAGCGGSSAYGGSGTKAQGSGYGDAYGMGTGNTGAGRATIASATSSLGRILVNGQGRTVLCSSAIPEGRAPATAPARTYGRR